jgi:hypothetical protein
MTVTVEAVVKDNQIWPMDYGKLKAFKSAHSDGEVVYLTVTDEQPHSTGAIRYWHKLRDRYADEMGYDREFAKAELKLRFGEYRRGEDVLENPPEVDGRFVEMYNAVYWLQSLREYTKAQLKTLTDRTKAACYENDIDIADLVAEHE